MGTDHIRLYGKDRMAPQVAQNHQVRLPHIYEKYLFCIREGQAISMRNVKATRRVLASFHEYLEQHQITLSGLKIEHIDAFQADFLKPFSTMTRNIYRSKLRRFLSYLFDEKITGKNLSYGVVSPRVFNQSRPPKFLRPEEIKRLFESLRLETPAQIRTYAMMVLAYSLGLRPAEIGHITLDDISFRKRELIISSRKMGNPVVLPIPYKTLKAIAAYVRKARPESDYRELFLTCNKAYRPISTNVVCNHISKAMKEAGLSSSAYWLRHSYAQGLLNLGRSIYEIKEMMGHQNIRSSQRYLHIHIELMRKVLLDETL
ncbi:MAG: tyrosine-type recombinase/integrase [Deltaproteobacteria bacterium]|nr:tyrosine-type recombinase/integrase [Deltaproteobacteria bacterium]MBT6504918.1 tyrosine-type recombinase/integrase [Deltaproteobacteria bacterium]MBT7154165.1 tyrosine-type recombinase/integrase [Deltaproteobacteria bacterium]MBT7712291.1 tyrosine-type recombinase/integrase [Deltaproteobacteria bacterium]